MSLPPPLPRVNGVVAAPPPVPTTRAGNARVIRLGTRCASPPEFIRAFAKFVDQTSVVIPGTGHLALGTECRFLVLLANNQVALEGRGKVIELLGLPSAPPKRKGVRLSLVEMDGRSREIHAALLRAGGHAEQPAPDPAPVSAAAAAAGSVAPPSQTGGARPVAQSEAPRATTTATNGARNQSAAPPARSPAATASAAPPSPPTAPAELPAPVTPAGVVESPVAAESTAPNWPHGPTAAPGQTGIAPGSEERARGSKYKLPANPFAEVDDEALSNFVECTLFEDDFTEPPVTGSVAPPPEVERARPSFRPRLRWQKLARRWAPVAISSVVSLALGYAFWGGGSRQPSASTLTAHEANRGEGTAPSTAPAAADVTSSRTGPTAAPIPQPQPGPASAAGSVASATEKTPTDGAGAASATPSADAAIAAGAVAAAAGECLATIALHPSGAEVHWNGRSIGTAPLLDARVPCGPASVTLVHPRYKTVELSVVAQPGTPLTLSEKLPRPVAILNLTSTPPKAVFALNRAPVGTAPAKTAVMQFERLTVTAKLPGFKVWSRKVYVKSRALDLHAQLEPLPPKTLTKRGGLAQTPAAKPAVVATKPGVAAAKPVAVAATKPVAAAAAKTAAAPAAKNVQTAKPSPSPGPDRRAH